MKNTLITAREKGQVVVEYVLLLVISVTIALIITRTLVNRDPDSPGFFIASWYKLISAIGEDNPEK